MSTNNLKKEETVMTKDTFKKTFWRSFPLQACFCYDRMQNVGFAYMMIPALKKIYPDKEEFSKALKRHLAIFNTTPAVSSFIGGCSIAMEEKLKKSKDLGEECDEESINAVKAALMGPLAGIGDSFFWGTFRVIGAGIGCSLALEGSILGAILFLVIFNVPHLLIRYYGTVFGYKYGTKLMSNAKESGVLQMLSKGATIVGLMVIGGMTAGMVAMSTPFSITIGDTAFQIQEYLDQIFPLLLPLLYTVGMFGLLKKGCKPTTILLITIAVGIVGVALGIL